jgi:hypothetical protein
VPGRKRARGLSWPVEPCGPAMWPK